MTLRLLDLFCGAGGASTGYVQAGFDVTGVDIEPQPNYPFRFVLADAMSVSLAGFDIIHASPPCQRYSIVCRNMGIADHYADLVAPVRQRLIDSGVPYVIENVPGAPLFQPITLCGSMFGLQCAAGWLRRHRWFELSWLELGTPHCRHPKHIPSIGVYGGGTTRHHRQRIGRTVKDHEKREAMGIHWMSRRELTQAIPPTYTRWIGRRFLKRP